VALAPIFGGARQARFLWIGFGKSVQEISKFTIKTILGNHYWVIGYCVDTVDMDAEMIKKYIKYQEDK